MDTIINEINTLETLVENENTNIDNLNNMIEHLREAHENIKETFKNYNNTINTLTFLNAELQVNQNYYRTHLFEANRNHLEEQILEFFQESYQYLPLQYRILFENQIIKKIFEFLINKIFPLPLARLTSLAIITFLDYLRSYRLVKVYELVILFFIIFVIFIAYLNSLFNKNLICFIL